jgi:spermidine/putrescine transport system substrate-binding protein
MSESERVDGPRITRRAALAKGAGGLLAAGSLATLLDAASSSSASASSSGSASSAAAITGTVTLLTYPQWYGPNEFADFEKLHPGVNIKTVVSASGSAAQVLQVATNKGAFDLTMAGSATVPELQAGSLLEPLDTSAVPNLSLVAPLLRKEFSWGIPTDLGKTGYAYRSDLISERPTSWHDFWTLAKKYSGKVTLLHYDVDVEGMALKYLGYSCNSKNKTQLQAMLKALLKLKPHVQALLETDFAKPLIEGTAVLAMDYDYDIAAAQQKNKHIVWVAPTEGMGGYVEGWVALKGSSHLPAVWALMNFHLEPKNYASFINFDGPSYVESAATPYIKKSIVADPSLRYSASELAKVEFDTYLGPAITEYRNTLFEEFLAA